MFRSAFASALTTNRWLRLNSVNAFQWRYRSFVKIFAFTLLFFSSSSRRLLQASSLQSAYTADKNTTFLPSGDQIAPSAPVEVVVSCRGFPTSRPLSVSKSHIQICDGSVALEVQMSRLPSGEKRGRSS